MKLAQPIHSVLFDLVGTTVKERGDTISSCFNKAFLEHVGKIDLSELARQRGKDKKVMIADLLHHQYYPADLVIPIFESFNKHMENSIKNFSEMDSAGAVFSILKKKKIKVGIGTGLPRNLFDKIFHKLGWGKYQFDYIGIADEIGASRPEPDMIFDMLRKTGLNDKTGFLKVGDTAADIREGKNAGVLTGVLLSGSQEKEYLLNELPDLVFNSLTDIKKIF